MFSGLERFIRASKRLLIVYIGIVFITPLLLSGLTGLSIGRSLIVTFEVATGEAPTGFEQLLRETGTYLDEVSMIWLFLLKFLSWLIIPILAGIIVAEGQQELERRDSEISEREGVLLEATKDLHYSIQQKLIEAGSDPSSAATAADSMLEDWDAILSEHD